MAYFYHPNLGTMLQHMFPNLEAGVDYIVQDDGKGPYLKEWNAPIAKPALRASMDTFLASKIIETEAMRRKRREEYIPIGDQLDAILMALDGTQNQELQAVIDQHKAIKAKYPKP